MINLISYQDIAVVVGELLAVIILFTLFYRAIQLFLRLQFLQKLRQKYPTLIHNLERKLKGFVLVATIVLAVVILALNGYLLTQNVGIYDQTVTMVLTVPQDFWIQLGLGILEVMGLVLVAWILIARLQKLLTRLKAWEESQEQIKANDESVNKFFGILNHMVRDGIWLLVLAWSSQLLNLPLPLTDVLFIVLRLYLIIATGRLLVTAVAAIVDSIDALLQKNVQGTNFEEFYSKLQELRSVLTTSVEYIIYVTAATLAMQQVVFVARFAIYGSKIIEIIAIFFLSRVLVEISNVLVDKLLLNRTDKMTDIQWQQRLTFSPLTKSFLKYSIYFGMFILILYVLEINVAPILAALGGIGLIIGLGAQPVILDMISGMFIVFENHYLVGDYIETGDAEGTVEAIDIRTTRIRNPDGQVHILRNGQLGDIVNFSKDYVFATVKVIVAYDSDLSKVFRIIETEGARLSELDNDVLQGTEVEGVSEFSDYALVIDTVTKAKPGRHREVGYHLRQLLKEAFDREGITIPLRTITLQPAIHLTNSQPLPVQSQPHARLDLTEG